MKTNLSSCCNAEVKKSQVSNKDFCVDCGEFCDLASQENLIIKGSDNKNVASPEVVATNSEKINSKLTASELFEGENSSLRKTYDNAVASPEVIEKWGERLRKEFQEFADNNLWKSEDGFTSNIAIGNVIDWWIEKMSTQEKELREKIEKIQKTSLDTMYLCAIDDILELINNK